MKFLKKKEIKKIPCSEVYNRFKERYGKFKVYAFFIVYSKKQNWNGEKRAEICLIMCTLHRYNSIFFLVS